ncbi:MAG: hypothetical protein ACE5HT_07135 [Gemmatimonadales bacterium]
MRSDADSVADYLAQLPTDRRETIGKVRRVILDNLPPLSLIGDTIASVSVDDSVAHAKQATAARRRR